MLKRHFPLFLVLAIVVLALALPLLLPWTYDQIDWDAVRAPAFSGSHIFGTDEIGRDRLARLAAGTRITLTVAIAAAMVSLVVGIAWGATAGWVGGRVDEAMMRIVDGLYALPFMFIVILLMVVFGRSILLVFVGIGLVEWLTMARVVRGQVMALKQRPFILAAEAAGTPSTTILWRHILPNIAGVALAYLMLTVPQVVMVESFLSFLGLGVQEPLTSLGSLLVMLLVCLTIEGERLRDRFS